MRSVLQSFLSDDDALSLLRAVGSPASAIDLLYGFTFHHRVFHPSTAEDMERTRWLCGKYRMELRNLCLTTKSAVITSSAFNQSHFWPPALTALLLISDLPPGPSSRRKVSMSRVFNCAVGRAIICPLAQPMLAADEAGYNALLMTPPPVEAFEVPSYSSLYHHPSELTALPLNLPRGLLRLHIAAPLTVDSELALPSTVEVLQVNCALPPLHSPLWKTTLPASLVHLVLLKYDQPLLPGFLPAGLQRLRLERYNQPLEVNVLPASLKALHLGCFNQPLLPGVLPVGLTHLSVYGFKQVIQPDVLPATLVSLNLGDESLPSLRKPLELPSSLRVLVLYTNGEHPPHLLPQIPDGVEVLHWRHSRTFLNLSGIQLPLQLQVLDLGYSRMDPAAFDVATIPAWVRLLRLPHELRPRRGGRRLNVPAHTELIFAPSLWCEGVL